MPVISIRTEYALHAVVPAAGTGSRMNSDTPKQFIGVNGSTILTHTIKRLLQIELLESIVVVLDEASYNAGQLKFDNPKITICIGGDSRAESVRNGLLHLGSVAPATMALVHDAARPCVRVEEVLRLIADVDGSENGGLLGMPVVDTIKRADANLHVTETVDRSQLWRAATPQLFRCTELLSALSRALEEGTSVTDEASAMQYAGYSPKLVECSADNIKITTATDLALAEHYLACQQAEQKIAH